MNEDLSDFDTLDRARVMLKKQNADRLRQQCESQIQLLSKYVFADGNENRIAFSNCLENLKYFRRAYFDILKSIEEDENGVQDE
jgi:hypothetical protein